MLSVEDLSVTVDGKELLHHLSFDISKGETVVLLGANGAGKSTLASTLMGDSKFSPSSGKILFESQDITNVPSDVRARAGLFLSFQSPVEVPGVSTKDFLRTALSQTSNLPLAAFEERLLSAQKLLKLDSFFASRDLNLGLSGGEQKKNEILQLLVLRPKLAILDEVDSGLDLDSSKIVSTALQSYQAESGCAYLVITHNFRLLQSLAPSRVLVLSQGRLTHSGGPELLAAVQQFGFADLEV